MLDFVCEKLHITKKNFALIALVFQTVLSIYLLRRSKIQHPDGTEKAYMTSIALVFTELFKLVLSLCLLFSESVSYSLTTRQLYKSIFNTRFLISGIPAAIYQIQNYLLFASLAKLPAGIYHASYQVKIFSTAIFCIVLLGKNITIKQWGSLFFLVLGISIIQISAYRKSDGADISTHLDIIGGLLFVILASLCSGFAGVYSEKLIKKSKGSCWLQSIHFALYGLVVSAFMAGLKDSDQLINYGMLHNFSFNIWCAIFSQSIGGIIIIMILKYADNIMKCLANSISIVLTSMISIYIFKETQGSFLFYISLFMVISSILYYSYTDQNAKQSVSKLHGNRAPFHTLKQF